MKLYLKREANIPGQGMFGKLVTEGFESLTVEREWLDNKPFHSCIPAGDYVLVPHKYRGRYDTFALVGYTVSHYEQKGFERYAVVIHPANVQSDLAGCIAPGSGRGFLKGQYAVTNSTATTDRLMEILRSRPHETHVIRITDPQ